MKNIFVSIFVFVLAFSFISLSPAHAQLSHPTTCNSYGSVKNIRLDGVNIAMPLPDGTYTIRWDPVTSVSGGSIGQPVTGNVWYHLEIDDLSTTSNPDFTVETAHYDKSPIAFYSSYHFVGNHQYRIFVWGRGGCGYGPVASVYTNIGPDTVIMGRVAEIDPSTRNIIQYWATNPSTGVCSSSFPRQASLNVVSKRLDTGTTGNMPLNNCNSQPYYSSGFVKPGNRNFTVQGLPSGYVCDSWNYSILNRTTNKWEEKAKGTGCITTTINAQLMPPTYDNSHHVWFFIKKGIVPTPTFIGSRVTDTPAPQQPTVRPTVTTAPTLSPTPVACSEPVDVMFVIDRSSSMTSKVSSTDSKTKLDYAKIAAKAFITQIQTTSAAKAGNVRAGVTTFGKTLSSTAASNSTIPLTSSLSTVASKIDTISLLESGTCVECGLQVANDNLAKHWTDTSKASKKIAIVLTDGRANSVQSGTTVGAATAAINKANEGKALGYAYFVVGFSSSGSTENTTVTKGVASTPSSTFYRSQDDYTKWDDLFKDFASTTCQPSIQGLFKLVK